MKRPITQLVVGLALLFSAQLVAQPTFTVSPQTITATPGQTVTVNIAVSNFTNILSFQYSINWSTSVLQFQSVTVPSPSPLNGFTASNIGTSTAASQGQITTSWFDPDVTGVSLPNNTAIYSITFTCVSASGTTIAFTGNPTTIEVINGNGQSVGLTPQNAAVNGGGSGGGGGGGGSNGLTVIASDESAAAGSTVCVDVSVNGFNDIVSMQFSMNFNPAVLQYTGVQGLNLQDLSASNFGTTQASSGNLTLSWLDNNAQGVTVPNGTVIFQVCFNVIGANGSSSTFNFSGNPTPIEVVNGNSQTVTMTPDNGTVTVSSGGGGGGGGGGGNPPVVGFAIIASDETVLPGQQVCVEISVNDFDDILSMQYSMEWDESKLQFQSITGLNLAHLTTSNFGQGQTSTGILTLSWFDNDVQGITLPDGTVIYQVCFTAVGASNCNATTAFNFTNTPTTIEVVNGNNQTVPWQGIAGDVSICNTPPPSGLKFIAQKDTAAVNETVCLAISVENFNDIASAQFSIHFNQAILDYDTVNSINLAGMAASNIGTVGANNGTLTFSWFDPTTEGITLPNGTVIFKLCFKVIGTNGQTANITFDGTPTVIEVTNGSGQNVTPAFTNGSVLVQQGSSCAGAVNIISPIITPVLCHGNSTGSIDISVNGGDNSYTYTWKNNSGTTVGTAQDLSGMPAGAYSVTVTSCGGQQTKTQTFTITQPNAALAIVGNPQVSNVSCFGQSTGGINLNVNGGTTSGGGCSGYAFKWNNNATTQNLSNVAAGAYTVTITDCSGCQLVSDPISVAQAPADFTPSATANAAKCFGQTNGSVVITPNGGVGPYQYRLLPNSPTWQNGNTFGNLGQANFTWEARDSYGCVKSGSVSVSAPTQLNLGTSASDVTANCNGSVTLTVSGGNPGGYTYSWTGPSGYTANSQNINNLCGGNYCVTVSDPSGCTSQKCQLVKVPLAISSTKKDACFGACNGEINLTVIGGIAPLNYAWSGGLSGSNPTGLCPGTYTVTVTSPVDNQSQSHSVTITEPATGIQLLGASTQGSNFTVNNCNGAVNINAAVGGYGSPFSYLWSNGYDTQDISQQCPGDYTVTVTDKNGCTSTSTFTVAHTPADLNFVSVSTDAPQCFNGDDGTLTIIVGGIAPFDYTITGPGGTFTANDQPNSYTFSGLSSGNYTITVKDGATPPDQQTETQSAIVESTPALLLGATDIYPATSTSKGKIEIEVIGGKIPYTFQWSHGFNGQNPSNLDPGCYDVTIVDDNDCAQVFQDICVELMQAQQQVTQPSCPGETGTITVQPQNGNEPYTYSWKNATGGPIIDTDATLENRPVGTYHVTITDALGVTITQTITLSSQSNLGGEAAQTGFITCFGDNNGAATATPQNGVTPYSYLWSNGAQTQSAQNLEAGLHSVTVTDEEDCEIVLQVNISAPAELLTTVESSFTGCPGSKNGQATAIPLGGTAPYTYRWNDPLNQNAKTAILLDGGTYYVTVTDENGCTDVASTEIPSSQKLVLEFETKEDEGGPDGEITVFITGGTWPYTFVWKDFPEQDSTLSGLLPGEYFIVVTDANGCQVDGKAKVEDGTNCLEPRSVITPEGDGRNEEFLINCLSRYSDNHLEIYNRWGQLVYQVDNYNDGNLWHGQNQRGEDVPDGVYYYVFTYQDPVVNEEITKKGSVSVLRK